MSGGSDHPIHLHAGKIVRGLAERAGDDHLITHQEGHLKVVLMETLLGTGHTILEGSNLPTVGFSLNIDPEGGRPVWTRGPRIHRKITGGSTDLASADGGQGGQQPVLYEIKSYPDHGSKCGHRGSLHDDIVRAGENPDTIAVVALDPKAYSAFSGGKAERRGRRGRHPHLGTVFPPAETVPTDHPATHRIVTPSGTPLTAHIVRSPETGVTFVAMHREAPAAAEGSAPAVGDR